MNYNNNYNPQQQQQQQGQPPPNNPQFQQQQPNNAAHFQQQQQHHFQQQQQQQNPNMRGMMQQQQQPPPGNMSYPQQMHQGGGGQNFQMHQQQPQQMQMQGGPNFQQHQHPNQLQQQIPGQQGYVRTLTTEQHRQFQVAQQQPLSSQMPVRSYLKQSINNLPTSQDHNVPVVTVSQANQFQAPSSTQAEHGSVFATTHGPSSNLGPPSANTGASPSVGQMAPGSVGLNPTSVGQLAPPSVGHAAPSSTGGGGGGGVQGPTSIPPPQQQQQQNTPQNIAPASVGGGGHGGPISVGPTSVGQHIGSVGQVHSVGPVAATYSEYPPQYADPMTDLKSLILKDLRRSIFALNEQIAQAAVYVQDQQLTEDPTAALNNPLSATPHSIINPLSIPAPKSIDDGRFRTKFNVEDYTNAYLRFFAVCDRIESRVAILTDSYRYHSRMQKMADIDIPARIKTAGYATVLQPCLDSMRAERNRILGTVKDLSTSLQEYRKITDEAEYCSIYPRKRKYEDIEDGDVETEYEENEFGELVQKRPRLNKDKDDDEEVEYEEVIEEVIEIEKVGGIKQVKPQVPPPAIRQRGREAAEYESPMTYESSGEKASFPSSMNDSAASSPREGAKENVQDEEESDEELIDRAHELVDSDDSLEEEKPAPGFYDKALSAVEQNKNYLDEEEELNDDGDDEYDNFDDDEDEDDNLSEGSSIEEDKGQQRKGRVDASDDEAAYTNEGHGDYEEGDYEMQRKESNGTDDENNDSSRSSVGEKLYGSNNRNTQHSDADEDQEYAPHLLAENRNSMSDSVVNMEDDEDEYDPPPPVRRQRDSSP